MVRIGEIGRGSIAEEMELQIGTRIVKINGSRVRDSLDFMFMAAENELEIEAVDAEGGRVIWQISRGNSESLGIVPARDTIRECANECVFCFIDGNPPDARESLWLRDDDFRLSFTYGSYVTLTNLGPRGLERLVEQKISPLYVSVHTTLPELRVRMLKNERAGAIMDQLERLVDGGLRLHTQVVLCPGWNDGDALDRTIDDLYSLGEGILSLSVVPVGLTRYNLHRPVRVLRCDEARRALEQTEPIRARAHRERGDHWCYAADEMFLIARSEIPPTPYYDNWELVENGVGALRAAMSAFETGKHALEPQRDVDRVRVVTGTSMRPYFERWAGEVSSRMRAPVEVTAVRNRYFGGSVTIAGLLAGADIMDALEDVRPGDLVLLPGSALNQEDMFIDGMPLGRLEDHVAPAALRVGDELTKVLSRRPTTAC